MEKRLQATTGSWAKPRWLGALLVLVLTAVSLAVIAAPASAQSPRQAATADFDSKIPGTSSGLRQSIDYSNPDDPEAKPPAVQKIVISLAEGSVIDTSVPSQCTAPDPVLIAQGSAACPPESILGDGEIDLDTGIPGPGRILSNAVELINNEDELIFLLTDDASGGRLVTRAAVGERTVTTETPPVPGGPPDGFTAILRVRLDMDAFSNAAGNYLTTPPSCPASGAWTGTGEFTYRDGVTELTSDTTPCVPLPADCDLGGRAATLGTNRGETINGGAGDDLLLAQAGNDLAAGRGGDDCVYGDAGKDSLRGNGGDDLVVGGTGRDDLEGNRGQDQLIGGDGFDRIRGAGGNDLILGGSGGDAVNGGAGSDFLGGNDGDDRLRGGDDDDRLAGGPGNDTLRAGRGSDRIFCGPGRDRVIVISDGRDRISSNCERIVRR